ncbi:hypothetical protein MCETHM1_00601 [Flavobacteriaceae bacterium]
MYKKTAQFDQSFFCGGGISLFSIITKIIVLMLLLDIILNDI